ncbi:collagen alpha-1(XXV) chain-like [Mercenaria mercenaria]|uniref:collagen alpha-1(XXV) chain-like n=1 Tax=Mercenaria mercenaria TaxID=6596 RepID=UPI00234F7FF6|nr:collagen alpha-1(XXV) chain-like [Mercenaria mercenaria]
METYRLFIFTGFLSVLMAISAGLTIYFILKAEFENQIEDRLNGLNIGLKQTLSNCTQNITRRTFQASTFKADKHYVIGNETLSKLSTTGNGTLCTETQLHQYVTLILDARVELLESAIDKDGIKGEHGEPGTDGIIGRMGDKGSQGETGSKGKQGIQGVKGDNGERGIVGTAGERGVKGEPGTLGPKGDKGLVGLPGLPGEKGEDGIPGLNGIPGLPGRDGPKGKRGQRGTKGRKGEKGEKGGNSST